MKSCYRMNERMEKSHTIVSGVSENNCCENMIHILSTAGLSYNILLTGKNTRNTRVQGKLTKTCRKRRPIINSLTSGHLPYTVDHKEEILR